MMFAASCWRKSVDAAAVVVVVVGAVSCILVFDVFDGWIGRAEDGSVVSLSGCVSGSNKNLLSL